MTTKYGVWFGGGDDGAPDWLRNQVGDVFKFDTAEQAQQLCDLLYSGQEKVEVRRYAADGGEEAGNARVTEQ